MKTTGRRYVIIGSAVLLFLLIVFAVAKGFLDVHVEEKCRLDGGTWQCAATRWRQLTIIGCDCVELIEESPPRSAPSGSATSPTASATAYVEIPIPTDADILAMMRRLPASCALAHTCSKTRTFTLGVDAPLVASAIAAAVNSESCAHILCTRRDDAAMMATFAVYDSGARKCGTWKGDSSCDPFVAAASWLARAEKARDDCMSDYGNIERDPPVYRTYKAPRGWQEPYSTDLASSWAVLIAGSCISRKGQDESTRRFALSSFAENGGAFEIEDDGSVTDVWMGVQ